MVRGASFAYTAKGLPTNKRMTNLSKILTARPAAKRITLDALCGSTRIWKTRLRGIVAGTVDPKLSEVEAIATALRITIHVRP